MTIVTCAPCPLVSTYMRSIVGVDLAMFGGSDILATLFFNGNLTGKEWVIMWWLKPELKTTTNMEYMCAGAEGHQQRMELLACIILIYRKYCLHILFWLFHWLFKYN